MMINNKVYDVSSWHEHPGGDVIFTSGGDDATDFFALFHAQGTSTAARARVFSPPRGPPAGVARSVRGVERNERCRLFKPLESWPSRARHLCEEESRFHANLEFGGRKGGRQNLRTLADR